MNSQTSNNENYYQILTTGASEQANKMNIYDLSGNEFEWILEYATYYIGYPCASRGGWYEHTGSYDPASTRNFDGIEDSFNGIGFRSTIY